MGIRTAKEIYCDGCDAWDRSSFHCAEDLWRELRKKGWTRSKGEHYCKECTEKKPTEATLPKGDWRTFQQWSDAGYKILKGSKATYIDGVAKFSQKQVEKKYMRKSSFYSPVDVMTDEDKYAEDMRDYLGCDYDIPF